jgi:hypothetical protein
LKFENMMAQNFVNWEESFLAKVGRVGTLITLPGEEPALVVKSHVGGECMNTCRWGLGIVGGR